MSQEGHLCKEGTGMGLRQSPVGHLRAPLHPQKTLHLEEHAVSCDNKTVHAR